jgi:uncharacterized repeat protein (TIGR02543 family)
MNTQGKRMKIKYNGMYLPVVVLLLLSFMIGRSIPVLAQSGTATSGVTASDASPYVGEQITVSINIDVSGVNAPDNNLGGYTGTLNWDPAILSYQSHSGAPPAGFSGLVNTSNTATGQIAFNGANTTGTPGNIIILNIMFNVTGTGTSGLDLAYSAMAAAGTFNNLLGTLTVNDGSVVATPPPPISFIGNIGTATANTSGTSLAITPTSAVNAGDDIIITFASDPSQTYEISVSDNAGNTYYQVASSTSSGNLRAYIFAAYHVNALTTSNVITITHTSVTARAAAADVFRGLAPAGALDQNHIGYKTATSTPNSGSITTTQADELLIGLVGTEGPVGDAAGSWVSGWTPGSRVGTTSGTADANITMSMGYQIVSSTGTYEASKSGITARDAASAIVSFKSTSTGILYIGDIGYAQSTVSSTSLSITTKVAVSTGDDIVVSFAMDATAGAVSVSDNASNLYNTAVADVTNSGNIRTLIFAANNVSALAKGSTIIITHPSVTARSAVVSVFRGLADVNTLDRVQTATGTGNVPSSGATLITNQADELLIGAVGTEGPNQDTTGFWLNNFTTADRRGGNTGSADANITIASGWRIVPSTGTYTASINRILARDWAAAIATFKAGTSAPTYTLTAGNDSHGTVTLSPAGGSYTEGTTVTLTPVPNAGYAFSSWTGANSGDIINTGGIYTIVMNGNRTVTANFTLIPYTLTVNISGNGTVSKIPDQATYTYGNVVALTATPDPGWVFSGWSGDLVSVNNPENITMNGNRTVTATFVPQYNLTVSDDGHGSVTLNPAGGVYAAGTTVTLTPLANSGYMFGSWTGANSGDIVNTGGVYTIVMNGNKSVTANFVVYVPSPLSLDGAVSSGTADGVSSINVAHTTGTGTDRLMLVGVSANSYGTARTISSVTFTPSGGSAATLALVGSVENESGRLAAIYSLLNPPNGVSGTVTITFSGSVGNGITVGVANFSGVNQSDPLDDFVSTVGTEASAINVNVPADINDLVFDEVFLGAATIPSLTVDASQTQLWNATIDRVRGASSTEKATSITTPMSWTASGGATAYYWAIGAVPINPVPIVDETDPTVTINQAAGQVDPANTSPVSFTVVFSEPVSDFATGDVTLTGTAGATTATVTGDGTTYNVAVSGMTGSGTVNVTIAADVATDAAGNPNEASTSTDNTVTYDINAPTVTIHQAAGQADPTNISPVSFTVVFSEPVTGFNAPADVTLSGTAGPTNTVITETAPNNGTSYNVAVSGMSGSGTVIAGIGAGVAADAAGNPNAASTTADNIVNWDVTGPSVTINQEVAQPDPTNTSPVNFTVVFTEAVSDFTSADVAVNGTAGATTAVVSYNGGNSYNVAVSGMTGPGNIIASIEAGVATDALGNPNLASTSTDNMVTWDAFSPQVTINQAAGQSDPTSISPINFTVVFNESVTGFITGDVSLNGTASATTATVIETAPNNGTTFNVAVSGMSTSGTVIANIAAGMAADAAGNLNAPSSSDDNTVTWDAASPTVTINQAGGQADPTSTSPINFAIIFSEAVSNFVTGDVTFGGTAGPTTAIVTGSGTTYNVAVSGMTLSGTVTASIAAGVATDALGNPNLASTSSDNTVTFILQYTLSVNSGGHGSVNLNPAGSVFPAGTVVTLTPVPDAGYLFSSWSGANATDIVTVSEGVFSIDMNGDKSVTANFILIPTFELTLAVNPSGGGTTSPAVGTHTYNENTVVNISASPASGYAFDHWTGDVANSASANTTVTLDGNKSVTAFFTLSSVTQNINLLNGWNIISLQVTPADIDMQSIVQSLINSGHLVKVQDETGDAIEFDPGSSNWINDIGSWINTEGYKIRVNNAVTLSVTGTPISSPVNIGLLSGWNIISYPASASADAFTVLNTLMNSGHLVKVQDEAGNAIERNPVTTNWINDIGTFDPGEGYKVRVSANEELIIDPSTINGVTLKSVQSSATSSGAGMHYKPIWTGNGFDHMNIYFSEISGRDAIFEPGDEIGIFDGLNCVGSMMISNINEGYLSIVVSADDPTTGELDGYIKGRSISVKAWRPANNLEATMASVECISGSSLFEPMGTSWINLNSLAMKLSSDHVSETSLGDNYPNPFSSSTTIPFTLGNESLVDIGIYNLLGERLNTLIHGTLASGDYTAHWDITDMNNSKVTPGIYLCKMIAGDKLYVKRIEVIETR